MSTLPPLAALRAFEAAARLGGFARAAAELNVSTSAVSHQIRGLEEALGVQLLERRTGVGGIRVTPAGQLLLPATSDALSLLEEACSRIRHTTQRLTVSANAPFSAMWLAGRIAAFSARHPLVPVHAIIQDGAPDFARHGIDLAIVNVPHCAAEPGDETLLQEEVFPVCSPELYPFASGAVCKCRLLQEVHERTPELDWHSWAGEFGLPRDFETKIVRYTSFSQVIGAAISGAGLALGRAPLIDPDLRSGRLVRLFPDRARPASWRFVLRRAPSRRHRMLEPLIDFLRGEALSSPASTPPVAGRDGARPAGTASHRPPARARAAGRS